MIALRRGEPLVDEGIQVNRGTVENFCARIGVLGGADLLVCLLAGAVSSRTGRVFIMVAALTRRVGPDLKRNEIAFNSGFFVVRPQLGQVRPEIRQVVDELLASVSLHVAGARSSST